MKLKTYTTIICLSFFALSYSAVGDVLWTQGNGKYQRAAYSVAFSKDGSKVAASFSCPDAKLRVYDAQNGTTIWDTINPNECAQAVKFSTNGQYIAIGEETGYISLWNFNTKGLAYIIRPITDVILSIDFSPTGEQIAFSSFDDSIRIINTIDGSKVITFGRHTGNMTHVAYSQDGSKILSTSTDKTIKIWEVSTGKLLSTFTGHTGTVNCAKFTPDGDKIISASSDKTVRIWDAATGALIKSINAHSKDVTYLDIASDGSFFVTCSKDSSIKVWETISGNNQNTFGDKKKDGFNAIALSNDKSKLVSGAESGDVTVWSLETISSIGKDVVQQNSLDIFPNPVQNVFTVSLNTIETPTTITITDLAGKVLLQETTSERLHHLDISNLPAGIYFLNAIDQVKKIVKQ